jgi:hypothetical protein
VSLQGSLRDFEAPDVFQLIAQQRKTGLLEVQRSSRILQIFFNQGRVIRARPGEPRPDDSLAELLLRTGAVPEPVLQAARVAQESSLEPLAQILESQGAVSREELEKNIRILTDETIFELFRWNDGAFEFHPEAVSSAIGDVDLGAEQVLLDAIRMKDEWARIEAELPDLEAVPVPTVDVETFRGRRSALESSLGMQGESLERLFVMSDGRRPARRVIDLSGLGVFEGARGLVALARENQVRLRRPSRPRWAATVVRRSWSRSPTLPISLPAVAALLISAAVAGMLWLRPVPQGTLTLSVPADGLEVARQGLETERIRTALEVERWVSGSYPSSLEVLGEEEVAGLAPPEGGHYSYERFSGGYHLFRTYP